MPDNDQDVSVNIVGSTEGLEEAGNAFAQLTRSLDSGANSAEALASRLEGTNKRIKQTMADTAAAVAIPDRPEPVIRDYKDTLKNKPVKTPEEKKELEKRNRQLEEASRKHMAEWNAKEEQREKDAAKAKQARAKKSNDEAMAQAKRNREAAAAAQQADSVAQVKKALGVADTETGNTGDPKGASSLLFWARRSGMLTGEFGKLASAGGRLNTLFGTLSGTAMRTAVGIAAGVGGPRGCRVGCQKSGGNHGGGHNQGFRTGIEADSPRQYVGSRAGRGCPQVGRNKESLPRHGHKPRRSIEGHARSGG